VAKLPPPPSSAVLGKVKPARAHLGEGTELWRIYFRGGPHGSLWSRLRTFGPTSSRFDHHLRPPSEQDRGILYAALHGPTCFAEVFQETRLIDRRSREPWLVAFRLRRPIELLDLTGSWPTRAGASMALNTGPRFRAREWSRSIYEAYPWADGLLYPSSMAGNQAALALYERGTRDALPKHPSFHRPLVDPSLRWMLGTVAHDFGYGLL